RVAASLALVSLGHKILSTYPVNSARPSMLWWSTRGRIWKVPRPDFPNSLAEFQRRFATEAACRQYLLESRWPDGYRCPRCRHAEAYPVVRGSLLECRACRYQTSVTPGTVMHRTRVALRDWFWAAYLVTTHTPGFSALQLQRQLGLGRYETAW